MLSFLNKCKYFYVYATEELIIFFITGDNGGFVYPKSILEKSIMALPSQTA